LFLAGERLGPQLELLAVFIFYEGLYLFERFWLEGQLYGKEIFVVLCVDCCFGEDYEVFVAVEEFGEIEDVLFEEGCVDWVRGWVP
jgi:hypothetical protein